LPSVMGHGLRTHLQGDGRPQSVAAPDALFAHDRGGGHQHHVSQGS
jgi:hypothetical protein